MIKLNDQKKLAEDYIYFKKCNNFFLLSLISVIACMILLLLITPNLNLLFVFFAIMYLILMIFRSEQLAKAKIIWLYNAQTAIKT